MIALGRAVRATARLPRLPWARCLCVGDLISLPSRSAALLIVLLASGVGRSGRGRRRRPAAAGWQGLLGSRPVPELGGRWIVVLEQRSLADRVRDAGGCAGEEQQRGVDGVGAERAGADARPARLRRGCRSTPSRSTSACSTASRPRSTHGRWRVLEARPRRRRRLSGARRVPGATGQGGLGAADPAGGRRRRDRDPRARRRTASRWRCSTPASTSSIPISAAGCCPASTSSTPTRARSRGRTRPCRGGPSGTAPSSRGSSSAPEGRPGCTASRLAPALLPDPGRRLAAGRVGRRRRLRAHRPAARRPRAGRRPERRRRRARRGADRARRRRRAVRGLRRQPAGARCRGRRHARHARRRACRERRRRRARRTAASAGPAVRAAALTVAATDTPAAEPDACTCSSAPGSGCSRAASSRSAARSCRGQTRDRCRSSRSPAPQRRSSARRAASPGSSTSVATAVSRARRRCSRSAPRLPRRCARRSPPARAPCSSTGPSRPGRSASTTRSTSPILGLARERGRRRLRRRWSQRDPRRRSPSAPPRLGANPERSAIAPFSSSGLAFDGRLEAGACSPPGVGLATSEPGRNDERCRAATARQRLERGRGRRRRRCGARRASARPTSTRPALQGRARRLGATRRRPRRARPRRVPSSPPAPPAVELVAEPPAIAFGAVAEAGQPDRAHRHAVRNVSRRRCPSPSTRAARRGRRRCA